MTQATADQPRLLDIKQIIEGDSWTETVAFTPELLEQFIAVSADRALVHVDPRQATRMGYESCLVHGFLGSLPYSRLLGMFLPGSNTVIHQLQLEMLAPVHVGDVLCYEVKVNRVVLGVKAVRLVLSAVNQHGTLVNKGTALCVFRT